MLYCASMEFEGSHGTARSFADLIRRSNRFTGSTGLRGAGAYFWRKKNLWLKLAKSWHAFYLAKGKYADAYDKSCVILTVTLACPDENYLNLEDPDIKEAFEPLIAQLVGQDTTNHALAKAYNTVFDRHETQGRPRIKLVRTSVTPPPLEYCTYYNLKALGAVSCLIARDDDIVQNIRQLSDQEVAAL